MTEDHVLEDDWPEAIEAECQDCKTGIYIYAGEPARCFSCGCKARGCTIVQKNLGHNNHYHCGRCMSPEALSMLGHYYSDDGKTWQFSCEEKA